MLSSGFLLIFSTHHEFKKTLEKNVILSIIFETCALYQNPERNRIYGNTVSSWSEKQICCQRKLVAENLHNFKKNTQKTEPYYRMTFCFFFLAEKQGSLVLNINRVITLNK